MTRWTNLVASNLKANSIFPELPNWYSELLGSNLRQLYEFIQQTQKSESQTGTINNAKKAHSRLVQRAKGCLT